MSRQDDEKLVFSQPRARGQRYPLYSRTWNRSREDQWAKRDTRVTLESLEILTIGSISLNEDSAYKERLLNTLGVQRALDCIVSTLAWPSPSPPSCYAESE